MMANLPGNDKHKQPRSQVCCALEVVDVHKDKHITASDEALDCLMLIVSQIILVRLGLFVDCADYITGQPANALQLTISDCG